MPPSLLPLDLRKLQRNLFESLESINCCSLVSSSVSSASSFPSFKLAQKSTNSIASKPLPVLLRPIFTDLALPLSPPPSLFTSEARLFGRATKGMAQFEPIDQEPAPPTTSSSSSSKQEESAPQDQSKSETDNDRPGKHIAI
jgi:hypothetical protein